MSDSGTGRQESDKGFSELVPAGLASQNHGMEASVLNTVDDRALAEAMVRVWGQEAALKASDNACIQAFIGNEETAHKWRRVMILIAAVSKSEN
ncbi:MAG TPA: hypothetical protein VH189_13650 [Rhizomicrobium sp.]|nr:hypothetical protein [Rhizomicrobium sp.]